MGPLGYYDSTKAKLVSLLVGLLNLKSLGLQGCLVEEDSKVGVSWALGLCKGSWQLFHCAMFQGHKMM